MLIDRADQEKKQRQLWHSLETPVLMKHLEAVGASIVLLSCARLTTGVETIDSCRVRYCYVNCWSVGVGVAVPVCLQVYAFVYDLATL